MRNEKDITKLLKAWESDQPGALNDLVPLVLPQLRQLARSQLLVHPHNHTWQPAALINELLAGFLEKRATRWRDRKHFFSVSAVAMRNILRDYKRKKSRSKRGGDLQRVTLSGLSSHLSSDDQLDRLALQQALEALGTLDPRKRRLVELRAFVGLSVQEAANALGVSEPTVVRDWAFSKAWLRSRLESL